MNEIGKGLIIVNLGSPDSPAVPDVRKYLNEFLMDGRVIDIPAPIRALVVKGFIVPFRAPKSAKAYQSIWSGKGSPLKVITDDFAALAEERTKMPVAVAMRYGNPSPAQALQLLEKKAGKLNEILIAPMYPHYAMSSYETALEYVLEQIRKQTPQAKLRILKPFYNEPGYIASLADSIKPFLSKGSFDAYLFSYHGLPVRHLKKSDTTKNHCYSSGECCEIKSAAWQTCYKHQVKVTTQLVAEKLGLEKEKVHLTFQSRLGSDKWIQPFTEDTLRELPAKGIKKLLVLCPAFVTDCLETLEEMDDRGKELFLESGGTEFVRVPCLNTSAEWVETFSNYCTGSDGECAQWWASQTA
ncbi:MAG: ferrochelatase [Chitinophagales bacterium]|nr:ferrochelatase [Chitinophagales bacterium]